MREEHARQLGQPALRNQTGPRQTLEAS